MKHILKSTKRYMRNLKSIDTGIQYHKKQHVYNLDPFSNREVEHETQINKILHFSEVEARIYKVLRLFKVDLFNYKLSDDLSTGMDMYEQINLLTAVEREFDTVFDENQFDSFQNLEQVAYHLTETDKCM